MAKCRLGPVGGADTACLSGARISSGLAGVRVVPVAIIGGLSGAATGVSQSYLIYFLTITKVLIS
ncbi:hypothetical protein QI059_10470 [Staphylococcus saprophyticus]|nr:hypothetical protein [Staphylococcus saprophyticus]